MITIDLYSDEYIEIFKEEVGEMLIEIENKLLVYKKSKNEEINNEINNEINKELKRYFHTLKGDFSTYEMIEEFDYFNNLENKWMGINEMIEEEREELILKILMKVTEIKKKINNYNKKIKTDYIEEINKNDENREQEANKRIELLLDFKKTKKINLKKIKSKIEKYGEIKEIKYINFELPEFEKLIPNKLYLKLKIVLETNKENALREELNKILGVHNFEMDKKIKEKKENIQRKEERVQEYRKPKEDYRIEKKIDKMEQEKNKKIISGDKIEKNSIRVNTKKLDKIINNLGELIVAHSSLRIYKNCIEEKNQEGFEKLISDLKRITKTMQENVLDVRMIPIENTLLQFKSMVRELIKNSKKEIDYEIIGGTTEIDKTIVEKIVDPLRHMIRNSFDHGIENVSERLAKGKTKEGHIIIKSYHYGGEVIIEIIDDGRGLDIEEILKKGIENGLVKENQKIEEEEILQLIFEPGFTTKKEISKISGRGIGMDVVKTNIEELRGKIEIETKKGKFLKFKIILPLTLAIEEGMLLTIGENIYVIPILNILESIQLSKKNLKKIKGKIDIFELRGEYIPLLRLYKIFKIKGAIEEETKATILIVKINKKKIGIMIDEVIAQQQIVIKRIKIKEDKTNSFSGATILGTGEVALILDVKSIYKEMNRGDEND
ncbi:MAG: hypothetical protein B6I28_01105 [Fusobacteriia bacterium 4572_132]|nr:MAG: hypothetical protein B6I28_01105 [Fusobacteriia bacterium 4572_132]